MSELFQSIKKNIAPFQNIIKEKTNMFIDTFTDTFSDSELDNAYSDDFDSESDGEISIPPKQQLFNENIVNLRKNAFSPINIDYSNKKESEIKNKGDLETEVEIKIESKLENNTDFEEENTKIEDINASNNKNSDILPIELLDDYLLCKNLQILNNLDVNQKLYVNYLTNNTKLNFEIFPDESYFPQLSRWYYSQSRINTINTIEKLINLAIQQLNFYKEKSNEEQIEKYKNLFSNSINGLSNLKITYETDADFVLNLNKIINLISENI